MRGSPRTTHTPLSPQQRAEHGGGFPPEPAARRHADDPEHAGDGPGRLPVHGQERGRGGEDAGGDPQVLWVSRYVERLTRESFRSWPSSGCVFRWPSGGSQVHAGSLAGGPAAGRPVWLCSSHRCFMAVAPARGQLLMQVKHSRAVEASSISGGHRRVLWALERPRPALPQQCCPGDGAGGCRRVPAGAGGGGSLSRQDLRLLKQQPKSGFLGKFPNAKYWHLV